ncbi:MAG: glycoside hydrolase family 15 protein [Thermoleophilia bacterium]|nr:glycoside hydrolase family 15 protein [Thermoleophilia bacterium]
MSGRPARFNGYAPIRDYAAIGDGRTVALIARDGSIDWLCLPDLDSPSVLGALIDAERGGRFVLEPEVPYEASRRYLPETNVLETTFATSTGHVRVTDAMTLPAGELSPYRELVRRVEGVTGTVPLRWRLDPHFGYSGGKTRIEQRAGIPVAVSGRDALALCSWEAGEPEYGKQTITSRFSVGEGGSSLFVLTAAHQEPLVLPTRTDAEARLRSTAGAWREWAAAREYGGPWQEAVIRSALALKLLVFAPSGAIAAAATTSLPEQIGGERNWDYRFSWPRDAAFTLQALLALGCAPEARAFFSWILHASQLTHPRLQVLYRLDGRAEADERSLPFAGYRGSLPVRVGNGAADQTQLDVYGEVLEAASHFASSTGGLDRDHGRRLAELADFVCESWEQPDAGIWETRSEPAHFIQSKMMCVVALGRACELAERGLLPVKNSQRWRRERERVREFVETRGYSERTRSYVRSVDEEEVDASLLLAVLAGYDDPRAPRLLATVDAVRRELARGPLIHRFLGDDGLPGEDGAFLACSFWLVEAYARQGRLDEAAALMDELVPLANDVGLFAEEIDPATGEFLGNFPQGLSHLGLINAAVSIEEAGT